MLSTRFLRFTQDVAEEVFIWYACVLHAVWGVVMIFSSNLLATTPTRMVIDFMTQGLAGVLFILIAICAALGLVMTRRGVQDRRSALLYALSVLPQQAVLIFSMSGGLIAVIGSQYADGVLRPRGFIFVDQFPMILGTIFHTVNLWYILSTRVFGLWTQAQSR